MPKNHLNYPIVVRSSAVENSCWFSSKLEKLKEIIRDYADDFVLFQELFPSFVATHLVSNPFSRRWQELPLVALPPPEKSGFQPACVFTTTGARTTLLSKQVVLQFIYLSGPQLPFILLSQSKLQYYSRLRSN